MSKKCIVDFRMRNIEKEYIKSLGYEVIDNRYNLDVYDEISSHPDIYYLKIDDKLVVSKCQEEFIKSKINDVEFLVGTDVVANKYPFDVPYNVCIVGKNAIHNFKFTDNKVSKLLDELGYRKINVEQGYSKCSTAIIDSNSCITSDIGIAKALTENDIDALFVCEPGINLLKRTNIDILDSGKMFFEKSDMQGFIGGAITIIDNKVIVFGDFNKLVNGVKIREFVESRGLEIVDFKGLDIIDYGGIIIID